MGGNLEMKEWRVDEWGKNWRVTHGGNLEVCVQLYGRYWVELSFGGHKDPY